MLVGLKVPDTSGPSAGRKLPASSSNFSVNEFTSLPCPTSDISNAFWPLGLTSKMSRSDGKLWFTSDRVTVTLLTAPFRPDTLITDGYGTLGAASARRMGELLKNVPAWTTVLMTRAVLFAFSKSTRSENTLTEFVTRPSRGGTTVSWTTALLAGAKLSRKQLRIPPLTKQNPWDVLKPRSPMPGGTWLMSTTFVAISGPRFSAVIV